MVRRVKDFHGATLTLTFELQEKDWHVRAACGGGIWFDDACHTSSLKDALEWARVCGFWDLPDK